MPTPALVQARRDLGRLTSDSSLIRATPRLTGACYNTVAPGYAFSLTGVYAPKDGLFTETEGGGTSPVDAPLDVRAREAADAESWYKTITADAFG